MNSTSHITDHQRFGFMQKLAADQRQANALELPEWEQNFMASWLQSSRPSLWFTPGRREVVNRMWMKYGAEIGLPHPLDRVSEAAPIADADPAGCEYLVREDGRQRRCNEPATCREPGKLRYCATHGEAVTKDCKRAGIKFCLINFQP